MKDKQVVEDHEQAEAFKRYIAHEQGCTVEEVERWQEQKPPRQQVQNPTA